MFVVLMTKFTRQATGTARSSIMVSGRLPTCFRNHAPGNRLGKVIHHGVWPVADVYL
jgi:hypothetical protein